jgi:lysyl-tRNA synthetase class I
MNKDQLIQFHEEVLTQETPDLYKIMLGQEKGPELNYLIALKQFVQGKLNK